MTEQFTQHDLGNFSRLGADLAIAGVAGLACRSILKAIAEKKRLDSIAYFKKQIEDEAQLLTYKNNEKTTITNEHDSFRKASSERIEYYQKIIDELTLTNRSQK